ncbi:MAG: hypothetical protein WC701_11505, partial [Kiritimatiellales bacterium]
MDRKFKAVLLAAAVIPLAAAFAGQEYGTADIRDPETRIPESVRPLFDTPVRDTQICAAPDGF